MERRLRLSMKVKFFLLGKPDLRRSRSVGGRGRRLTG